MNLKDIITAVARRTGAERDLVSSLMAEILDVIEGNLDHCMKPVKIRRLGSFEWKWMKPTKRVLNGSTFLIPGGYVLKFTPAALFKKRRTILKTFKEEKPMSDEGMTKYGVVQDEEKVKEASTDSGVQVETCPICGETLDNGGACPEHGTEPFEKKNE